MSQKTKAVLISDVALNYPDNTAGEITPLNDRTQHIDEIDSALNLAETGLQTVLGLVNYTGGLQVNGAPVVTGLITIAVEADFTNQDATTITLEANKTYLITTSFSTAKYFDCDAGGISITALNKFGVMITGTGTGALFRGVDVDFNIDQIGLNTPSGSFFDFSDVAVPNSHIFWASNIIGVNCAKFGTLTSMASFVVADVAVTTDCTDGLSIVGSGWRVWRIQNSGFITTSTTFIGVDLGTATTNSAVIGPLVVVGLGGVGAVGVSGLANSGNITVNNVGRIDQTNFIGNVIPTAGITNSDIRWLFTGNDQVSDTIVDALISLTGNATDTIISTINTPVLVAGVWVCERESLVTCTTAGRATIDAERMHVLPVDASLQVEPASGTNTLITAYWALNGTKIVNSGKQVKASSGSPLNISVPWQLELSETNYLELFVENNSGTIDILVSNAILRVR